MVQREQSLKPLFFFRIKHLILADPWGFPERPNQLDNKRTVPLWVRAIAFAVQPLNPLWAVRFVGPFGQWVIEKTRPDIIRKFSPILPPEDGGIITQYIYQCNSQSPTGESAFHAMMSGFGWAKFPMVKRIDKLREDIPITLIYGSKSWVDNSASDIIKAKRMNAYVNVQVIQGAGHHVYADRPDVFNKHVLDACGFTETKQIQNWMIEQKQLSDTESEVESEEKNDLKKPQPVSNRVPSQVSDQSS